MKALRILSTVIVLTMPLLLHAVDLKVADQTLQIHGFASQGFAYSNQNNFLTMKTSKGSGAMTDFGANVTLQLTDKLRVGAQIYDRNIGQLGGWRPQLDYAYIDYRLKDWLGFRGGRVKTKLGLYTSTQDADFLRTWALLPQAVYPTDLRSSTIAHDGVDIYGEIPLRRAGSLTYTLYAGARPTDTRSGQYFQYEDAGFTSIKVKGSMAGADLQWSAPISGLTVGVSQVFQKEHQHQNWMLGPFTGIAGPYHSTAAYGEYNRGRLQFAGEYRRNTRSLDLRNFLPFKYVRNLNETGWFASASFRVNKVVSVGTYHSRYTVDEPVVQDASVPPPDSANHIFDQAVTVRFDLTRFWNVKVEGHFMDGTGDPYSPHGFYQRVNPTGTQPTTNMLVVRTGWNF